MYIFVQKYFTQIVHFGIDNNTLSQDFATHFLHVSPHDGTLVFHYVVGDVYLHYGLSPIN